MLTNGVFHAVRSRAVAKRLRHTRTHTTTSTAVHVQLRELLRDSAQPVAVVTSLMPNQHRDPHPHSRFHGATLSSFSTIAMEPHPLVAFSLRIPSRMATSLKNSHEDSTSHLVINMLSAVQADVAVQFSRPDLHPHPFSSIPYSLTEEGLPILRGSLGALSCKLVATSWPLHDLGVLKTGQRQDHSVWKGEGVASELFIAEVIRVEPSQEVEEEAGSLRTLPLLYHRRSYSTTQSLDSLQDHPTKKQG